MKVHIKVPDGSSRIRLALLADPRRNTSKEFFEAFRSGDEADTCFRPVSSLSPLFVDSIGEVETERRHTYGDLQLIVSDTMPGKPFQSSLIPYQNEIAELRSRRPPVSYARIADLLREEHGLRIQRAAIAKFVKARSGGRKVYFFRREVAAKKSTPVQPVGQPADPGPRPAPKPVFEFKYSERDNLTRLPPEVAAARRKKLEEGGH